MIRTDSDSESQDSDDGRRFRFEATRKDCAVKRDVKSTKSSSFHREKSNNSYRNDRKDDRLSTRDRNYEREQREKRRDEEKLRYNKKSRYSGRESESFERDIRYRRKRSVDRDYDSKRDSKSNKYHKDSYSSTNDHRSKHRELEGGKKTSDETASVKLDKIEKVKNRDCNVSDTIRPGNSNSDILSDLLIEDSSKLPTSTSNKSQSEDEQSYGPALPPKLVKSNPKIDDKKPIIGPKLPDNIPKPDAILDNENDDDDDEQIYGPILPSNFKKSTSPDNDSELEVRTDELECDKNIDDDDDGFFGPLPLNHPAMENDVIQQKLEYRAHLIRQELAKIDSNEETKREEWMTELPAVKVPNLGLTSRKFRARTGPDMSDRSEWTDTPADKVRKLAKQSYSQDSVEEDHEEKSSSKKEKRKQEKSLMELHQEKIRKERKKEEKKQKKEIRKPFSRDVDLQINRIDQTRNKNIVLKAHTLDDRFSRGKM